MSAPAARLWRAWLGRPGSRPPPLDRFLSRELKGRADGAELSAWLFATAAWAIPAWCATHERAPEDVPTDPSAVLDMLRSAAPDTIVAASGWLGEVPGAPRPSGRVEGAVRALRRREDLVGRLVAAGIPPGWGRWLGPALTRMGPDAAAWLGAQGRRPPLWARPARAESAENVASLLREEGLEVALQGDALKVSGRRSLRATRAYQDGRVEIQDAASQQIVGMLGVEPGGRVWDACAGRGGKTVQLARALQGRGVVWATDTDEGALADLKLRLRRAGWADTVRVLRWDGKTPPSWGREGRGGPDRVLVDAPCSATGTWRRNPDARLRPPPGDPARWASVQRDLLRLALDVVRPGGTVVYATCSVLVEEDEGVLDVAAGRAEVVSTALHGCPRLDSDTLFGASLKRT